MPDEERASLEEILQAADEGGIPIVMDGRRVTSIEEVPEEIKDLRTDGLAYIAPGPGRVDYTLMYRIPDDHRDPIETKGVFEPGDAFDQCVVHGDHSEDGMDHRETDTVPTKQREGDQVLPSASRALPVAHEEVIEDLQDRLRIGISRYGQGLRPFNGRNTAQDEYEELLDQIVYKKTQLLMREASRRVLVEQVTQVLEPKLGGFFPGRGETGKLVCEELAIAVVERVLDCFNGHPAQAPDAG